jgi:hypothetical protein
MRPEGDDLIQYVADPDLKPPVAMLLHAVDEASLASFMPFAEFSPEWQAMDWALKHKRPVRFCDWPAAISLALKKAAQGNPGPRQPKESGAFLEGFLRGGSEVLLQDEPLLQLLDAWLCELNERDFTDSLPLLRRSMSSFDAVARRRMLEKVQLGRQQSTTTASHVGAESNAAFEAALPLLCKILGLGEPA